MIKILSLKQALLFTCSAAILATGCKKDEPQYTDSTFVSHINTPLTLDIYGSLEDYAARTNRVMRKTVQYGESLVLTKEELPLGKGYYADWYNDDHNINNWYNPADKDAAILVSFTPVARNNTYYLENGYQNKNKTVFLKNEESQTNWTAVGAYLSSPSTGYVSVWDKLTADQRYHQVTVRKDFVATYTYRNNTGLVAENMNIKPLNANGGYIEFMDGMGGSTGYMRGGVLPTGKAPEYLSNSVDTVMALFPHSEEFFMMVRQ